MKTIHTSGKRKEAVARATLTKGSGKVRINKALLETISPPAARLKIEEPLLLAEGIGEIDLQVSVRGGGVSSQVEAARLAIAKALVEFSKDKELEGRLLSPNRHGQARAKRQKSYR